MKVGLFGFAMGFIVVVTTVCASEKPAARAGETVMQSEDAGPYLSLKDLKVHAEKPAGPYIRGMDADGQFVILSDVEGDLPEEVDGEPGYLEINTLSFMSAREARAPIPPYVQGKMTTKGFVPTSRSVVR